MLTLLTFSVGIFLVFAFGYQLSKILLSSVERLEQICLGYVLGIGLFTFVWFLVNLAGVSYNLVSGLVLLLSLNIVLFIVCKIIGKTKREKPFVGFSYFKKLNIVETSLLGITIFLCVSALIQDIYWPIRYWDSLTLYDFRAHLFAQTGSMQNAIAAGSFFGYPLLTSLAHTWVYLLGGTNPNFLYALLYISLLIVFYFNLKKLNIGRTITFFLTAMVAVSPRLFDHTQWAYTNLPYSIYIILGSIYLFFGIRNKNLGAYITSALLIALSTWTRSTEPFWLSCLAIAIIIPPFQRKWFWPFIYSFILASIMLPWRYFQFINGSSTMNVAAQVVSTSKTTVTNLFQFTILKSVFDYVMANVIYMYLGYFVIFGIIIIGKIFIKSKNWIIILLIMINLGIIFCGTLVFATSFAGWHEIPDSLSRMAMFMPTIILFLCAEFISELKNINEKNHL
jgi:hypothetical protein